MFTEVTAVSAVNVENYVNYTVRLKMNCNNCKLACSSIKRCTLKIVGFIIVNCVQVIH